MSMMLKLMRGMWSPAPSIWDRQPATVDRYGILSYYDLLCDLLMTSPGIIPLVKSTSSPRGPFLTVYHVTLLPVTASTRLVYMSIQQFYNHSTHVLISCPPQRWSWRISIQTSSNYHRQLKSRLNTRIWKNVLNMRNPISNQQKELLSGYLQLRRMVQHWRRSLKSVCTL